MPESPPPLFDDGGGLPEVERDRPSRPGRRRVERDDGVDDRGPNFLVRRAIVVGVVVMVIAAGAVGVGRVLDSVGGDDETAFGSRDWNTIVAVDRASGTVVLTDDEGEETGRFRLGVQPLTDARIAGSTVVATSATQLAVVDLDDTDTIVTTDIATTGTLLMPSGSAQTMIAHDEASERAVFVHGPSGDTIDTDTVETVVGARYGLDLARSDPSGRHVLVTDAGNFQSVLFSFDRDEPSFFPGLALAVSDSFVVTAQNVGTDATVSVFDHAGEPQTSARTASVRAGMLVEGAVILVTVDGTVLSLALTGGEASTVGRVDVGTILSGHVAPRGDRLIVVGELGTAIVGSDGAGLVDLLGAVPTSTGIDHLAPRRTDCLIVDADGEVIVVSLEDGAVLAEAIANPEVLADVAGCTPIVPTPAGYLVVTADGVLRATIAGEVVAVSPDSRTLLAENENRLLLLPVVDEDAAGDATEPIDVGRAGRIVFFADL